MVPGEKREKDQFDWGTVDGEEDIEVGGYGGFQGSVWGIHQRVKEQSYLWIVWRVNFLETAIDQLR